ncbi:glycoside hydrolase family 18 protein [Metarhizium rileyi]|uniref:chitinase n=1 Tax=Metarhizium rileyi (strain RCEF 4871) TaxID=1649241 RepID=A0A162JGF0_METRR|nr:glycoside hydrolase family 18 protein [Metarhizium rileyi RCEF 4871]
MSQVSAPRLIQFHGKFNDEDMTLKRGFCGYTYEFCEGNEVKRPSCSNSDTSVDRVIGYYEEGWATSNRGCNALRLEEIPYGAYTHLVFSFATINPKTFEVSPGNYKTEDIMERIGTMKLLQPNTTFSDVAASKANTNTFLSSLVKLMDKLNFDGVDIDWGYLVAPDRHGRGEDYENIVTFMKKLRERMDKSSRGVSMALPASYRYLQHFNVVKLEEHVDWFNLMTYDMHGAWDIDNMWTGPWANSHTTNLTEIQLGLDLLWRNDIPILKVQRDGHKEKEIMLDTTPCFGKGHGFSRLCCPTSFKSPTLYLAWP